MAMFSWCAGQTIKKEIKARKEEEEETRRRRGKKEKKKRKQNESEVDFKTRLNTYFCVYM